MGTLIVVAVPPGLWSTARSATPIHVDDFLLVEHTSLNQREDNLEVSDCGDGTILASWTEEWPAPWHGFLQRFTADGVPVGPRIDVSSDIVPLARRYRHSWHDGLLPDGRIAVVHEADVFDTPTGTYPSRSYLQFFDTTGLILGPPILLHDTLDVVRHWGFAARGMTIDDDGTINVLFWDWGLDVPEILGHLYLTRYDSRGNGLGASEHITNCPWDCANAEGPTIHSNGLGRVIISWDSRVPMPNEFWPTVYFRVYDDGVPFTEARPFTCGGDSVLNCGTIWQECFRSQGPYAAIRDDGNFAISMQGCGDWYHDSALSMYVQVFDGLAQPVSGLTRLENYATHVVSTLPYVEVDEDSGYVVGWMGYPWYPRKDFFLQRVTLFGERIRENYRVNTPIGSIVNSLQFRVIAHQGGYTCVWLDSRNWQTYGVDIYAERVPREKVGKPDAGDVDGGCTTTSSDIIYLVNHVIKGGDAPLPPCGE